MGNQHLCPDKLWNHNDKSRGKMLAHRAILCIYERTPRWTSCMCMISRLSTSIILPILWLLKFLNVLSMISCLFCSQRKWRFFQQILNTFNSVNSADYCILETLSVPQPLNFLDISIFVNSNRVIVKDTMNPVTLI